VKSSFTGAHDDFTLSGGLVLCKPHLPVPKIAAYAQQAEKTAKAAGRNRLKLFGLPVPWRDLSRVREIKQAFARRLRASEGSLPRGIAYRLLELHRLWQLWDDNRDPEGLRYKPLLHYLFRHKELREHWEFFSPLCDHTGLEVRFLPVWVQWAIYQTRGERGE